MRPASFLLGPSRDTPPSVDASIAAVAARQHGLVTFAQLVAAGLSGSAISKRVARGALHRIHRTVYAVGHHALSREARFLAAVLTAGDGAALSHFAAAELWQVRRYRAPVIEVVAPHRRRAETGLRFHRARRLHPRDVTTHRNVPVTTIARTLVDLTDDLHAYELTNVIHEAAFRGRYIPGATQDAMARANGRHHLHRLVRAIALHDSGSAGTRSRAELAFLLRLERAGLPEPQVNVHLHGYEVDFHWPARQLAVEIDGPGHARARSREEDAQKDRALHAAGYEVLRFTDRHVEARIDWVADAVTRRLSG